jgi:cyclopropane fatty-acyl-phospholipid synthase-like methyltransferase
MGLKMSNLCEYTGEFYDADYFERGKQSGKGWLENYRWMPRRSFKEALAYVDYLDLNEDSYVLDFGCSKGFIVKAMRMLEIKCDGCDISPYALSFAPEGCINCSDSSAWGTLSTRGYTHIICKDVLEHMTPDNLHNTLCKLNNIANIFMVVIPMGDCGTYRIPEYHTEISHIIAENEMWWVEAFEKANWKVVKSCNHVPGLKDNWYHIKNGNHVFYLARK